MKKLSTIALFAIILAACGQPAVDNSGAAEVEAAPNQASATLSADEQKAVFTAIGLAADAKGQVENECGEKVTPQILSADFGGPVGVAQIVIVPGGPNTITCYGDGPGLLTIVQRQGSAFKGIFTDRGGISILPSTHQGAHDISVGGPGFSFPVFSWNGAEYAPANKTISDTEFAKGQMLP
ncbi:MAG: hypothetical protein ABWZ40_01135 [Caulobacterales bacterium]